MTEKENDSSTSSTVDEDNMLSDEEQEKSSSQHSSSSERSENMAEAVLHKGGGNIKLINPIICIAAGNIENIKHEGSRETINALKMAHRGGIFTTTEHNTRSTLAVGTPSGDTSTEEPSISDFQHQHFNEKPEAPQLDEESELKGSFPSTSAEHSVEKTSQG